MSKDEVQAVFSFLDNLRDTGAVNMFGAAVYVRSAFGYDKKLSSKLTILWMENFADAGTIAKEGLTD